MRRFGNWLWVCTVALFVAWSSSSADTYVITLDSAAAAERGPVTGRIILFFITRTEPQWRFHKPLDAPFFDAPQPIASVAVTDFKPGDSITIDGGTPAFPASLDTLQGKIRVQAILDADQTERSHDAGPGNFYSDVVEAELSSDQEETINITLTKQIEVPAREDKPHLKWVKLRSEKLSEFYGRDVYHRAGVALPKHYHDEHGPQEWAAIYVIPGFGGRDDAAEDFESMLLASNVEDVAPIAVYIVLDPEAPLGHHGFCDSANNGPRATALVEEFIPYLESQFRLVAKPEARLITGHSSGGWASLWLQLRHSKVFGGCWSSAPDPIDFSALQMTDLYSELNMFADEEGNETPSYRKWINPEKGYVPLMTVRQEVGMEQAIDPHGRSGQQWAAWNAMFSPRDPETGLPVPMFDPATGKINKRCVRHWGRSDIAYQTQNFWNTYGPVVLSKVHLMCGDMDSYYLNRAVASFKEKVEFMKTEYAEYVEGHSGGYIEIVEGADHETLPPKIFMRWNDEMRKHLQRHGLQDADAPAKTR